MGYQDKPQLVALHDRRDAVIDTLSAYYADETLDLHEFELRLELAYRASTITELNELLADLESASSESSDVAVPRGTGSVDIAIRERSKHVFSVLGSVERRGTWRVPKKMKALSVLGHVLLDFREADFGPGVTEVTVRSVLGAVSIVVPPDLDVECEGTGIIGHFGGLDRNNGEQDPDAPLLRISGVAVMGAAEITTRLPGEDFEEG